MYFKIINNQSNMDPNKFFIFVKNENNNILTRGHCHKIRKRILPGNQLFNSFCNRAVDCWNSLPAELVTVASYAAFSRGIAKADLSIFLKL
jgi:hypothetical protein